MKKTIVHFGIVAVLVLIISGCRKEGNSMPLSLNEKEYYSDSQLSTISPDGDSACFIGNEKGDIYRYDKSSGRIYDTLRTGTDRIYNVVTRKKDNAVSYFVGVRNSGLMMFGYDHDKLVPGKTFLIGGKNNYSPYNTIICGDRIYVATSHGLFFKDLSVDNGNELERLYPMTKGKIMPFLTTSLIKCGYFIYVASESGLIRCDVRTNKMDVLHGGEKIKSARLVNGKIYSLSEKKLYIDGNNGKNIDEYDININADIYYHAGDTHYFISSDRVVVAHDYDLKEGTGYKTIPLRRNVRPDCRNVIMADSITGHSILVTDNALFRIPFHLDVFNTDGKTTAACSDGSSLFFVTNNSLFRMRGKDNEAERIADLPDADRITSVIMVNDVLYYINGNTELKRKAIGNSFIYNRLSGSPQTTYRTLRGITAAGIGSDCSFYIGIRDSLLLLQDKKAKLVRVQGYPFVNRISVNGSDGNTYAALLNGGVVRLHGDSSSVEGNSARHHFIKDIAFATFSSKPCILTNHFLFSPDGTDSVATDGFSRLLTADGKTFYALMETGIRKYIIDKGGIRHIADTLCDIRFSPSISLVHGDNIYFGATSLGIIELKPDGTSQWIRFNHNVYTPDYKTIIFFIVLICLSAGFVLWYFRRKEKDLGIYNEWEKVRKMITKINPGHARKLETDVFDGIDSVDKRSSAGKDWLERYKVLKDKAASFRQLTRLDVSGCIFGMEICNRIYKLDANIGSRSFDIEECKNLCESIETDIKCADMRKVLEMMGGLCNDNEQALKDVDKDFATRLGRFGDECSTACENVECAIRRIYEANNKLLIIKAAESIARIRERIKIVESLVNRLNEKEIIGDSTKEERDRIKKCSEVISEGMQELYYALSQDAFLAGKINIKQRIRKEELNMSNKEKVLMLLIAAPETKSEVICHVLGNSSLNNVRSTLSKVRKEIMSIGEDDKQALLARKDSMGRYILRVMRKK